MPNYAGGESNSESVRSIVLAAVPFNKPQPTITITVGESRAEQEAEQPTVHGSTVSTDSARDPLTVIQDACEGTGTDWRLVYAIGKLESGYRHWANTNNAWGRKAVGGGYMAWSSFPEAARDECEYIYRQYTAKGLTTLPQIGHKYASDPAWPVKVQRYLDEL